MHQNTSLPNLIKKEKTFQINTHKHYWVISHETGNAYSIYKKPNFFRRFFRKKNGGNYNIYDYFTDEAHIEWTLNEAKNVIKNIFKKYDIPIQGKKILDISGGNGLVADALQKLGAKVILTEVNENGLEYAKNKLNIETYKFDFQDDAIDNVINDKFDVVLLRAAVMFCLDISKFLEDLKKNLNPGALVIMQYCVSPTLGTIIRTQLDEYNYLVLLQPETLIDIFQKQGFKVLHREDEVDLSPYVYDHDARLDWTLLRIWYEFKALKIMPFENKFPFRVRERRRSNLIFSYDN